MCSCIMNVSDTILTLVCFDVMFPSWVECFLSFHRKYVIK